MPHSRSTSESPVRIKKDHHRRKKDKDRHKRHREKSESDDHPEAPKHRSKHKKGLRHEQYDPHIHIKQEPSEDDGHDHYHRRIKHEPIDEWSEQRRERANRDEERRDNHRRRLHEGNDEFGRSEQQEIDLKRVKKEKPEKEKEKPNFEPSGKLADETNTFRGVVVKYNEPPEARKPKRRWRLFPFKGDDVLPTLPIHRQSAYLLGRDRIVADIPTDHPSCSKQHAALQFRMVTYDRDDGTEGRCVRPYVIDLESANGTYVNNNRIESRCYMELREKDVIKFGFSSREYVLLHDKSDTTELQDGEDDGGDDGDGD